MHHSCNVLRVLNSYHDQKLFRVQQKYYKYDGKQKPDLSTSLKCLDFATQNGIRAIDTATAYGTALGLDTTGLLLALLLTQIVAFPAALIFGKLSSSIENTKLIKICIFAYFLIALYGITLQQQYQFWILAVGVGIFQGAIQSLSRSYYAKIIPANRSGEYFYSSPLLRSRY